MNGKVCVVTGAASGIGQQLAIALAQQGATVIAAARDQARTAQAVADLVAAVPNARVEPLVCDVASIEDMKRAAQELLVRHPKLDLLVNNAACFNRERQTSKDGLELGYAVNTLAPFVMSNLLLPGLQAGAPSRIVNMAMTPTAAPNFDDLQLTRKYSAFGALQTTKAGHHYLTVELARKLAGTGVTVVTVDPGLTRETKLTARAVLPVRIIFKLFGQKVDAAVRAPLAACTQEFSSGTFVSSKCLAVPMPSFIDAASAERLWKTNAALARL